MKDELYANKKTKTIHQSIKGDACRMSEIKPSNRETLSDEEAVQAVRRRGYKFCKICFK